MKSFVRVRNVCKLATALLVLSVAGCAVGVNISRPQPGSLIPGKSTYEQVVATYGEPWVQGTVTVNEKTLKTVAYAYGSLGGASYDPNVGAGRGLNLWFENDILVGHEYRSSFKEDHTDFDESRIKEIDKGKSNKAAVIKIFGLPTGEYIYPLLDDKGTVGLVYSYVQVKPGLLKSTTFQKKLVITIDESELVRDVEYSVAETQ